MSFMIYLKFRITYKLHIIQQARNLGYGIEL